MFGTAQTKACFSDPMSFSQARYRLGSKNKRLRMERETLSKAAPCLARETVSNSR